MAACMRKSEDDPLKRTGILTDRQKRWMTGDSNDYQTENPVLYKKNTNILKQKEILTNEELDAISVRGLLKNKPVENPGIGNIIERTQAGRRDRHEIVLDDIEQELASIALSLEPKIESCCSKTKLILNENRIKINGYLEPLEDDSILEKMSFKDLESIHARIADNLDNCESHITEMTQELQSYERERSSAIAEVLQEFTSKLVKVAHLMPADVHRLIEAKVNRLNESILGNQLSYSDLSRRLMIMCVGETMRSTSYWESRVQDWRDLRVEYGLLGFKDFMTSDEIVAPSSVIDHMKNLNIQQEEMNKQRLELINQLRMLKPPCSKSSVHQWNNAVTLITSRMDDLHIGFLNQLRNDYEEVQKKSEEYMSNLVQSLFDDEILPNEVLETHLESQFQMLLGEQCAVANEKLTTIENQLSEVCADQKKYLTGLFTFAQGAAHEWDCHELALVKIERTLQEQLDRNRREHDYQNQIKEAKLDIVMDRMRQDSSEEALAASLKQVMGMLEEIQAGYHDFNTTQKNTCDGYSDMVTDELTRYTSASMRYFSPSVSEESDKTLNENEDGESGDHAADDIEKASEVNEESKPKIICSAQEHLKYLEIEEGVFAELRTCIYKNFMDHLPDRKEELKLSSQRYTLLKIEEVNNELDLRLHLHEPRATRATQDVHNVRAAELLMHRDRVTQHCQGLQDALQSLKQEFQSMIEGQMEESEKFKRSVEELEQSFTNATKPHQLKSIQSQVNGKLDEYMEVIRASVRHFRYNLDDILNKLRASNASLRKTLRIFSDGGNFSPDEVKEYRKKLEKSASRIDNVEGSLMAELEGMETKRLTSARDYAGKLEDRFKHHLLDLMFVDKISRWLSNIQVKIKTEAAESNSQAQTISKMISTMHGRIEYLQNPIKGEKAVLTVEELHETVLPLFESVQARLFYLNCAVNESAYEHLNVYKRRLVEPRDSVVPQEALVPPPVEKEIPVKSSSSRLSTANQSRKAKRGKSGKKNEKRSVSPQKSVKKNGITRNMSPAPPSKHEKVDEEKAQNYDQPPTPQAASIDREFMLSPSTEMRGSRAAHRTHFGGKYDKKYLVFGEYMPIEKGKQQFHTQQLEILQVGLDGLLCTAEMYYKQKGVRASTRPDQIHDSFDLCAENLILRLKKYQDQMKVYANSCVQEFRAQLKLMLSCMEKLPSLLTESLYERYKHDLGKNISDIMNLFNSTVSKSEVRKREHKTLLRPTLGHPNSKNELNSLISAEAERSLVSKDLVHKLQTDCQSTRLEFARKFVVDLDSLAWRLLLQADHIITVDDVIIGTELSKPLTEVELLRKKKAIAHITEEDSNETVMQSTVDWPVLDVADISHEIEDLLPLKSLRNLSVHKCIISARDKCFKDFGLWFNKEIDNTADFCHKLQIDETRWLDYWNASILKIREFYST